MNNNKRTTSAKSVEQINQQIIEIKKKIQLSEGQRKAAFEEYETERKQNSDLILKLKKEIKELTIELQVNKDESAVYRVRNMRLETILGPLGNKTVEQVGENLDLHIIDLKKQLDLVKDRVKQRKFHLNGLAEEYKVLLSQKPKEEIVNRLTNQFKKSKKCTVNNHKEIIDIPSSYKKRCNLLQNEIHRMEIQFREAEHVRSSYKTIERSLLEDRGRFESTLQQLEDKKQAQDKHIEELQKMTGEARTTKCTARLALEREERSLMMAGRIRERQYAEQESLVNAQRIELEKLERQIFLATKSSGSSVRPTVETTQQSNNNNSNNNNNKTDDSNDDDDEDEVEDDELETEQELFQAFDKLKEVSGATNAKEVLAKFQAQMETRNRLNYLKETTEMEKKELEIKQEGMNNQLERFKFAQEKDVEKYGDDIVMIKCKIEEQIERKNKLALLGDEKELLLRNICTTLYKIYTALKDIGVKISKDVSDDPKNACVLIKLLQNQLVDIVRRSKTDLNDENYEIDGGDDDDDDGEEEILPQSYNALLRRTPLNVPQGSVMQLQLSPTPVVDDDEEVPSRSFLKRQAQLVVDAKSRRKGLRIPVNRK